MQSARRIYLPAPQLREALRILQDYRYAQDHGGTADMDAAREALRRLGLPPCAPGERIELCLKPRIFVTSRPTPTEEYPHAVQ